MLIHVYTSILLPTIKYAVRWNTTSIVTTHDGFVDFQRKYGIKKRYLHNLNVFEH